MKTKNIWKINTIAAAIIAGGVALPSIATAAESTATLEEVVVVGSRGAPRSVGDSPVPVDVISADELGRAGSNDLMMQLQSAVPSLNVHLQPISDAASMIRPANLRGLSSDSTLIMVNGKRRHRASVIAFQGGGVNDGSQGPDISVIPSIALKSVEVLRDGAAAQYGSDAVAGVINFVLNDSAEGGSLKVKQGQFSEGDGDTTVVMGNFGMPLTDAGFMNISFQMKENEATSRSVQRPDAQALIDAGNNSVTRPAQIWGAPIIDDDVTFFFNSGLDLGNGGQAYMFGNYSERDIDGGFYFRNPDGRGGVFTKGDGTRLIADVTGDMSGNCPTALDPSDYAGRDAVIADPNCYILNQAAPGGYTPRFVGNITDSSFTMGRSGEFASGPLAGTAFDISGSVGRNEASFGLNNTFNPSMGPDSPRDFETGSYIQLAKTFNVDMSKEYDSMSVAYGAEWRETTFSVISGEEASWVAGPYATQGFNVGSHGFAGFSPDSAGAFSRRNYAVYGDVSNQVSDDLLVQGAIRYEDYSSGLDTTNYKLAFNYQLTDDLALRGSHSTGFRAPTQGQANVVNTQTTLVDGQLTQAQTLPGFKLGAEQLQPEESTSFAIGIVATLGEVELTADWFNIEVDDRIALTSNAAPTDAQRAAMTAAGIPNAELIGEVNYFTNDFNTETSGLDIVATYSADLMGGSTDFSAAYNYTDTEVSDQGNVTSDSKVKRLEEGLPNHRATFTMDQQWENVSAFVRANYYGEYYAVHADWFGTNADSAMTVDVEVTYDINDNFNVSVGAQNIFDQEAEKIDGSAGAVAEGVPGNVLGAIYYETSPMGIEGAFWYVSAGYNF
ncbi:MAG: TonB-dependent receptor [SAR92 clade bacterium]|uniref:TonB-dependent receptor n=1 Tax=SAR92 clade bacterium TaxID=2315479 RepID=A0A520MP86_9GAMM|nr:MAG: TonB-dependent receptor [SAR92 clade bacterium]